MHCTRCGVELSPGDGFCGECGSPRPRLPAQFERTEREFRDLSERYRAGTLTDEQYDRALQQLVIQDEKGSYWMLGAKTGAWYHFDGREWIAGEPPLATGLPRTSTPQAIRPGTALPRMAAAVPPPIARRISRRMILATYGLLLLALLLFVAVSLIRFNAQITSLFAGLGLAPQRVVVVVPADTPIPPEPTPSVAATEIPLPASTPTATPTAAVTPRVIATGTSVATPTIFVPTAIHFLNAQNCPEVNSQPFWSDDFSNPKSGWAEFRGVDNQRFYESGTWHFQIVGLGPGGLSRAISLAPAANPGENYRIEVRTRALDQAKYGQYGVVFGYENASDYVTYSVSDLASFAVLRGRSHIANEALVQWSEADVMDPGSTNVLVVQVTGKQFDICMNGRLLARGFDPALKHGRIGLYAETEGTHVHFDNMRVWKLQ